MQQARRRHYHPFRTVPDEDATKLNLGRHMESGPGLAELRGLVRTATWGPPGLMARARCVRVVVEIELG